MASHDIVSMSRALDLTRVVKSVDEFSHAVHTQAPLSFFYLDQAHDLTGRVRNLEKRIIAWDNHMVLSPGRFAISKEEFEELRHETQSIRMAAKGIHGYFNYHLPRIQADLSSTSPSQSSSDGSSLNLSIDSGSGAGTSAGYQSATSQLLTSQSSGGSGSASFGWETPPHCPQGPGQGPSYTPPLRAHTPSHLSDVSSASVSWSNLGGGAGVAGSPSGSGHGHGSIHNYPASEGGASGSSSGSVFSPGRAPLVRGSPAPSPGHSSNSSRHYTPL